MICLGGVHTGTQSGGESELRKSLFDDVERFLGKVHTRTHSGGKGSHICSTCSTSKSFTLPESPERRKKGCGEIVVRLLSGV